MGKPVAIQGIKGSFHYQVAKEYFNSNQSVLECMSFDSTVDSLINGTSDYSIMALENSIAGSIIPNYALIDSNDLEISGEYYLDIQHHLMALPDQSIKDIIEVQSHPMALLQCKTFLKRFPHIKLVEAKDTAAIAKDIRDQSLKGIAAIASQRAAELFNLEILGYSIQSIKHNETRFAIVKRKGNIGNARTMDKASLKFVLGHKRGSLATMLNVMSDCKLNLTKIQSIPIIDVPWKYAFFVDVTFDNTEDYLKAKSILMIMAEQFKVLGEYKNARL